MSEVPLQIRVVKEKATIQVDPESHAIFLRACKSMPQTPPMGRVASGLVRWFSKQKDAVKTALMSGVDEGMEHVYARALREAADDLEKRAGKRPTDRVVTSDQVKQRELEHARQQKQLVAPRK